MNSKKFLRMFLTMTLALSSTLLMGVVVSDAKTSADVTDLKDLDAATKAKFDALISAGIFEGDSGFRLEEGMNRAQFAKVAALIFNLNVDSSLKKSSFSDVKVDDPALPYIEALKKVGITTGITPTTFNPADDVTVKQLATFLIRGLGKEEEATDWAKGYVGLALEMKLFATDASGSFEGRQQASSVLLASGAFEAKKMIEVTQPLEVSEAEFMPGNKLELTLTTQVDLASIDLSKITINGVPLDSNLDSFELSEDKKTIIIKLHTGFQLDTTKTPVIVVNGLKTLFGNELKNDTGEVPIPVKVTEPPYTPIPTVPDPSPSPTPVPEEPAPAPAPEEPNPNTPNPNTPNSNTPNPNTPNPNTPNPNTPNPNTPNPNTPNPNTPNPNTPNPNTPNPNIQNPIQEH
ncbi:S-layer homology domain-containing protein [Sporosarcina limicola]|uniref:SLH domain-containing protein n=1 Tax=Sporosarcina limicola TaxID=34101 RepID=A0A927MQ61_9BACL|nr:S-layer homology domain-containing protein [Sporosarcina limicola]MBE1555341.1 hypothetical protein [Sporosarcina limicola]